MADQGLSHAEVWDDSALVDSWNEALEEYKKYHSLAVKGEKVRLNPQQPAEAFANAGLPPVIKPDPDAPSTTINDARAEGQAPTVPQPVTASEADPAAAPIPQALFSTVQNDDLKNLMMSWYYAGYYTGLYEGKQQGYASAIQRHEG